MSKPSAKKPIKADVEASPTKGAARGDEALQTTQLTPADQRFLDRVMRFLVSIQSPVYVRRARQEGYTAAEHKQGWHLWQVAAGADRPLDHWFAEREAESPAAHGEQLRLLQEIDTFENTWFPRTRAIIRRMVPRDARDEFTAAFFKNLEQQPLGPGVVGSVSTFIARTGDLAKSASPHAKLVRATLDSRGLTAAKLAAVTDLLARASHLAGDVPAPKPDTAAIQKAQAAQLEGLADLRDWFNDWGTALRSVLNGQEQIRLGLLQIKRGASAAETEAVAETEEEEEKDDEDEEEEKEPGGAAAAAAPEGGEGKAR
jgi:hypothetical protein